MERGQRNGGEQKQKKKVERNHGLDVYCSHFTILGTICCMQRKCKEISLHKKEHAKLGIIRIRTCNLDPFIHRLSTEL
jgi:hypothetical protein